MKLLYKNHLKSWFFIMENPKIKWMIWGYPPMTYETSIYQKVIKGIDLIIGTVWKCNELHL